MNLTTTDKKRLVVGAIAVAVVLIIWIITASMLFTEINKVGLKGICESVWNGQKAP